MDCRARPLHTLVWTMGGEEARTEHFFKKELLPMIHDSTRSPHCGGHLYCGTPPPRSREACHWLGKGPGTTAKAGGVGQVQDPPPPLPRAPYWLPSPLQHRTHLWAFVGGERVIMAVLTQSPGFFLAVLGFSARGGYVDFVEKLVPPILDRENSKIKVPWSKEMVAETCEAGKLAGFQKKTLMSLNSRPQPTTGGAYISNISFP